MPQSRTVPVSPRDAQGLAEAVVAEIPPTLSPDIAAIAARTISRAEAMGLIHLDERAGFDRSALVAAVQAFQNAGIGRQTVLETDVRGNLRGALELLNEAVEHSPHPPTEWRAVSGCLGLELVAKLTGLSETSVRRYANGERESRDAAAERLHFIALVVADLAGSYNSLGIRRWFSRPRRLLGGAAPQDLLVGDWEVTSESAGRVAALARSLTSLGAA